MTQKIRAVQIGLGPIGSSVARVALKRANVEVVGAVDIDKAKVGRDLGRVIGLDKDVGVIVSDDLEGVFASAQANVAFHHTSSSMKAVTPQVIRLAELGVDVVSTTEELAYPYRTFPDLAEKINEAAKANKITVLSTGVNPGYLMDTWPLATTAVCQEVKRIKIVRIQDARPRRLPFQKKIGAGRTLEEFAKLVDEGTLRHVGLPESIDLVAAGLGWELDDITEAIEPIMARERVQSQYITVEPGQAAGVRQIGLGLRGGEELIRMEFEAYLGAPESYEAVYITGTPDREIINKGGTHGDVATAAIVLNSAHRVVQAPPGLVTMKDMPLVVCTAG